MNKFPGVGGTSKPGFIPELYYGQFLESARDKTVAHSITNDLFTGSLKKSGDTVKFSFPGQVTNRPWVKGQTFQYDEVQDDQYELVVDRARQWGFVSHKTDDVQAIIKSYTGTYKKQATDKMAEDLDSEIFAEMVTAAYIKDVFGDNSYNFGTTTTSVKVTKSNALQIITNAETAALDMNWDISQTWMVVPNWFCNCLANGDMKDASAMGISVSPLFAGIHTLGQTKVSGITLLKSNLLPKVTVGGSNCDYILFGTKRSFCLADQIEMMGVNDTDKDNPAAAFHYGLYVYGMKNLYPTELGKIIIEPGTNAFSVSA